MKYREIMQKHRRNAIAAGITACALNPAYLVQHVYLLICG